MPRKRYAWTRKKEKPKGGLNAKGRASYNRAIGNLKAPTPNQKLKNLS